MRCLLLATLLLFPQQETPREVTKSDYVVVFTLRKVNLLDPEVRIHMLVKADSEGEATLKGYRYMYERVSLKTSDDLVFVEAQRKN